MNEVNETFEMFKEQACVPEMKDLIQGIQEMYNQKEELQQRIDEAIEYIQEEIKGNYFKRYEDEVYKMCEELLDILKGVDKE